jgi:branched-chain amino acid transport system permease protein
MEDAQPMKSKYLRFARPLIAVVIIYLVLLLGPIASLDIPVIAASIKANPLQLIQFLIIGLANGAIVAIIALGYTMVYGIIELINFAHGDVYMIGVFTALTTLSLTGSLTTRSGAHRTWYRRCLDRGHPCCRRAEHGH